MYWRNGLTLRCWPSDQRDQGLGYLLAQEVPAAVAVARRRLCWLVVFAGELEERDEPGRRLGGEALLLGHEIGEACCWMGFGVVGEMVLMGIVCVRVVLAECEKRRQVCDGWQRRSRLA